MDGTYDVDDSITGIIRTDGPVISFNGAWAQNIGENEMFIDFMGDKAGIRLQYGGGFVKYGVHNKMLSKTEYQFRSSDMTLDRVLVLSDVCSREKNFPPTLILRSKRRKLWRGSISPQGCIRKWNFKGGINT